MHCHTAPIVSVWQELWSKIADNTPEIRVKLGQGIVGAVATTGKRANIPDAYRDRTPTSGATHAHTPRDPQNCCRADCVGCSRRALAHLPVQRASTRRSTWRRATARGRSSACRSRTSAGRWWVSCSASTRSAVHRSSPSTTRRRSTSSASSARRCSSCARSRRRRAETTTRPPPSRRKPSWSEGHGSHWSPRVAREAGCATP